MQIKSEHSHPALTESYLSELDTLGVIEVSGEETVKYLQGQITIDVSRLSATKGMLGCHCDFKGKCWNIFYLLGDSQTMAMVCHKDSIAASLPELKKYGVFAKVEIEDASAQWRLFGGYGSQLEAALNDVFGTLPSENHGSLIDHRGWILTLNAPRRRFLIAVKSEHADDFLKQIDMPLSSGESWEYLDIAAGIANIQQPTSNEFVPQMLNMQALDAIDFKKGCYMGQEVVARTKYLGKNKRAAFILKSEQTQPMHAGDTLEKQVGENWRRGGTVIRCATLNKQTWILAVLANDTEQGMQFRNKAKPEQTFTVQPLPYTLNA